MAIIDNLLPSTYSAPPPGYVSPSWPGLYNPFLDAKYLYVPSTIWKFTLYWTLLLEGIVFTTSGLFASFTILRSGGRRPFGLNLKNRRSQAQAASGSDLIPLTRRQSDSSIVITIQHRPQQTLTRPPPISAVLAVPLRFSLVSGLTSLISGSIIGWTIAALYNAAFIRMSTWVPALWSAGFTLIVIISSYSSVATVL